MRIDFIKDKTLTEPRVIIQAPSRTEDIEELIDMISGFSPSPIKGYSEGSITRVSRDSIIRIYSKDKRVYADTVDGSFVIKSPLYQLEEDLPSKFVRISNSEIVNSDKIIRLEMNLSGKIKILLEGDIESYVSRRYIPKVKEVLI
jgi:DNA-binding LytR/AlgR family response regulator